jgi:hypothetical protein
MKLFYNRRRACTQDCVADRLLRVLHVMYLCFTHRNQKQWTNMAGFTQNKRESASPLCLCVATVPTSSLGQSTGYH